MFALAMGRQNVVERAPDVAQLMQPIAEPSVPASTVAPEVVISHSMDFEANASPSQSDILLRPRDTMHAISSALPGIPPPAASLLAQSPSISPSSPPRPQSPEEVVEASSG